MTDTDRVLQLAAFADGEVAPAERAVVEQYLASDPEAAADVAARRALRAAIHRAGQGIPVPEHVRERVTMMVRHEQKVAQTRGIRLTMAASFAAAAVIVLAVTVGGPTLLENTFVAPPPAAAYPVSVSTFLDLYERCDGSTTSNELGLAGKPVAAVNRAIRNGQLFSREELNIPDLAEHGFELVDVSRCNAAAESDSLLALYVNQSTGARLTVAICSRPLTLRSGAAVVADVDRHGRQYERVDLRDGLALAKWDERYCSVVLCAQMPASDLLKIADTVRVFKSGGASLAAVWS